MPIIIAGGKRTVEQGAYFKRMIRCPGHYLIPPKVDIYLREPVEALKKCSNWVELMGKKFHIKKMRIARDRFGQKRVDWKKLYELRKKGIVLNPLISAAEAIERIWDPQGLLCQMCDKRCREGQGAVVETTIRRLKGLPEIR